MDESDLQSDEVAIINVFVKNIFSVILLRIKWMEKLSIWQRKLFDIKNIYDFTMTAKIENFHRKDFIRNLL